MSNIIFDTDVLFVLDDYLGTLSNATNIKAYVSELLQGFYSTAILNFGTGFNLTIQKDVNGELIGFCFYLEPNENGLISPEDLLYLLSQQELVKTAVEFVAMANKHFDSMFTGQDIFDICIVVKKDRCYLEWRNTYENPIPY